MRRPAGWLAVTVLCALSVAACVLPTRFVPSAALSIGPAPAVTPSSTQVATPTRAPAPTLTARPTTASSVASNEGAVAVVNGTPILRSDYEQEVARATRDLLGRLEVGGDGALPQGAVDRLRADYLEMMIQQVLIEQAAADLGIEVPDALVAQRLDEMRDGDPAMFTGWLETNGVTEEYLHEQLRRDLTTGIIRDAVTASVPRQQPHVRLRHILVPDLATATAALDDKLSPTRPST